MVRGMGQAPEGLSRRAFLIASSSGLLLSSCSVEEAPHRPAPVNTVDSLTGTTPFYIAHRGSGDNWAEHTKMAYDASIAAGAQAIEVSVQATSDGVLVCHHDLDLLRMEGIAKNIKDMTYAELAELRVDARPWLGPSAPPQPIPKLADVLDAWAATHVVFLEDKQGTNTKVLLDLMDTYPDSTGHFVWKQDAGNRSYEDAQARGYKTWGYFVDGADKKFEKYAARHDFVGIYHLAADAEIQRLVGFGKPTIGWEVHTRAMRDRLLQLGVRGMMCSNIPYVMTEVPSATADTFATGLRAAGDLPSTLYWPFQPLLSPADASATLADDEDQSYALGSMCPIAGDEYSMEFQMCWPDRVPASVQAGMAFGLSSDAPYHPLDPGPAGYHLLLDAQGGLRLYARQDASPSEVLSLLPTAPPDPGSWVRLRVAVSSSRISFSRLDGQEATASVADVQHRGGYFALCKPYRGTVPVAFRSVRVGAPL
jgi:glycerophosphoryl diester phosphodiesterase